MKNKAHYHGHRARLRERFILSTGESFEDYELLELLLFYAIPRKDTKSIAKALIQKYRTLKSVLDAPYEDLLRIEGIGPQSAVLIKLSKKIVEHYMKASVHRGKRLSSPETVVDYLKAKMSGLANEQFRVFYLDNQNRILKESLIHDGTPSEAVVYPRKIIEEALRVNATGIILVHNHPSGSLEPSTSDRLLTERISRLAKDLGIRVLDHIIITSEGHCSFLKTGLL